MGMDLLPSPGDLFSQQAGISVGVCQSKCHRIGAEASSGPPPQFGLMLVSSDLQEMSVACVVTRIAHLLGVL
jgi:hypothetical protein